MISKLRFALIALFILATAKSFAQAPNISYASPQIYTLAVQIPALTPVNTGGAVSSSYTIHPGLPRGLSIDAATGVVSGTPELASPAAIYTVIVSNASSSDTTTLNISVALPAKPAISYTTPQVYHVNEAILSLSPVSTGGTIRPVISFTYNNATPRGLTVDPSGNIFVADNGGARVVEFPVSGSPIFISNGLTMPNGVASDASGNIFVADQQSTSILEILAGTTTAVPVFSGFSKPVGVAIDKLGNLYVSDQQGASSVKRIAAGTGVITTLASGFTDADGIAVDASGNVYYCSNYKVNKIPTGGGPITTIGSGILGATGVAVDAAGNIFVADEANRAISVIPANGGATYVYYSFGDFYPQGVAFDPSGDLYFTDEKYGTIAEFFNALAYSISPALPAGLSLNPVTGVISGTPAALSPATDYIISATNPGGTSTTTLNIRVSATQAALSSLMVSTGTLTPGFTTANTNYTLAVGYANSSISLTAIPTEAAATLTINGIATTAGTASAPIDLSFGTNTINVVVTSSDGTSNQTYTINATRPPASVDANLAGIGLSNDSLNPGFAEATTAYTVYVGNGLTAINITPTADDLTSTITVNGNAVASGTSAAIPLSVGPNNVNIVVTAQDGTTQKTYQIVINEAKSGNTNLSGLTLSSGSLSPVFVPATITYTAVVDNSVPSITLTPTVMDGLSTVTVNGVSVSAGTSSVGIPLTVGTNKITVAVTAAGGDIKTYTVVVTRSSGVDVNLSVLTASNGVLIPGFASNITVYNIYVGNLLTTMQVTPTAEDPAATITVNGAAVTSGTVSGFLPLTVGTNTYNIVVTGRDGTTTRSYTLVVHESKSENYYLASLTTSSGIAQGLTVPATISQTVTFTVSSVTVTPTVRDATSTITVNGVAVTSGSTSAAIPLTVGENSITIVVTAQDTKTKTYSLAITRASSAHLANLVLSRGVLNTPFSSARSSYSTNIGYGASFNLTPTAVDPGATITVNGTPVASGSASGNLTLTTGHNTVNISVTGSDGLTTVVYTVLVNEARSDNADLFSLKTSSGLAFGRTVPVYATQDVATLPSVAITPKAIDAVSTITINGTVVASGSTSSAIPLTAGAYTKVTIIVTAQAGTTKTYEIDFFRFGEGSDNSVYQPLSVEKPLTGLLMANDGILVHQGISPNGDGINDFLQIDNISNYPDNRLSIINRNGQLVYELKGYDNATKVFDGHSNKSGQMQLPGTYFYSLDYTIDGVTKHKTGFLVLKY